MDTDRTFIHTPETAGKPLRGALFVALLSLFITLSVSYDLFSSPVRRARIFLTQPDGTSFTAFLSGDEHVKVLVTPDGTPVVQQEDGFYCHAFYDSEGGLHSTGQRADAAAPSVARAGAVPYETLLGKAMRAGHMSSYRSGGSRRITSGTVNVIVILAAFKDLPFTYAREDFLAMLNDPGYSVNGSAGSVRDYFLDQFGGRCDFRFDVSEIVTLPNAFSYYGRNDNLDAAGSDVRVGRMIYDACVAADGTVDFSRYDNDGDGELESVMVIFAGGDEASGAGSDHIWSQSGFLNDERNLSLTCDGVKVNCYACTSELLTDGSAGDLITNIGTFCHEYLHTLGLPDFYDKNGLSEAFWGKTSIMDRGNLNNEGRTPPNLNALERRILGLSRTDTLKPGQYMLHPVNLDGECLYSGTGTEGEYFLFECREASGWDSYIGGSGMLVYHVDSSANPVAGVRACDRWLMSGPYANTVNSHSGHQCADLQEADPTVVFQGAGTPEEYLRRIFYPYGENDAFTPASSPAFESWSGEASEMSVADIRYEDGSVRFQVYDNEYSGIPAATGIYVDVFQDAAIITWSAGTESPASVVLSDDGDRKTFLEVEPYEYGKYSVTFEHLRPSWTYSVAIGYSIGGITGRVQFRQISTHPATRYQPYIYLHGVPRNSDGSFPRGTRLPLRLYNATDAEEIEWTMDGSRISVGADGYYVPEHSGMLQATAFFPDGTEYRVSKRIEIKGGEQ